LAPEGKVAVKYPALEYMRASLAGKIIRDRRRLRLDASDPGPSLRLTVVLGGRRRP
jgi:hypothetical protein